MQDVIDARVKQGIEQGGGGINRLNNWLFSGNRADDVLKAATDRAYQEKLMKEYRAAVTEA